MAAAGSYSLDLVVSVHGVGTASEAEAIRVERLLDAQAKAAELFEAVEAAEIIAAGVGESEASAAIRDLAAERFGVQRHWHKRIVRAGVNTLQPYHFNPPERVIEADDIVFLDFGPIFEEWEADFGRTYVLGDDPVKHRLCADLPALFDLGRAHFEQQPDITGEQLFGYIVDQAEQAGWEWGGEIAGHIVGEFPHEGKEGDDVHSRIVPGSDRPMRGNDRLGRMSHWILEIHIVNQAREFGGFYEELLDIGTRPTTAASNGS
jgi:Xaa-Pro aminopeptidase